MRFSREYFIEKKEYKMDLTFITQHYIPVVLVACLVVGYCIKHIKWLEAVSNQYIPSILAILGAVLGCVAVEAVSLESIVYGAVTGLASTGLHQVFSQIINKTEQ
jgi:hypothetical protein